MQIYNSLDQIRSRTPLGKSVNSLVYTAEVEFEGETKQVKVKEYMPTRFFKSRLFLRESATDQELRASIPEERLRTVKDLFLNAGRDLCEMKHPALAQVIGVIVPDDSLRFGVVTEHYEGQTLRQILSTDAGKEALAAVPLPVRIQWLESIASALLYIHSKGNGKLHRNLHNANILINLEQQSVVLVDYFAEWFYESPVPVKHEEEDEDEEEDEEDEEEEKAQIDPRLVLSTFTMKQSPPETLFKIGHYESSDVWSFGLLVCEITYCEETFKGVKEREIDTLMQENRLPFPWSQKTELSRLDKIARACLQIAHKSRPAIPQIVAALHDLKVE